MTFSAVLTKLVLFVLIVAVAIPLRYGSTNPQYLIFRILHSALSLKHSILADSARPTLSAEYRAFEDILRMKPIGNQDLSADPMTIVKQLRSSFSMDTLIPKPSLCRVTKEIFEYDGHSADAYWIDYPTRQFHPESGHLLVYFHGGGFILGDIQGYSGFECHLSQLFNMSVLHVEYRLSPEYPLPAPVEDAVAIYRALLRKNISPSQLMFMGDSAGGGLVLLTIQTLLARQLPVPHGTILLSPYADASTSGESYTRNVDIDVMLSVETTRWAVPLYLGPNHSKLAYNDSLFSPLFGSFNGFPPLYVAVGTAEIVEDDSRGVVKKAREAGVDVIFEEGRHLQHVYPLFFLYFPEARNTLDNINNWIQKLFTQEPNE